MKKILSLLIASTIIILTSCDDGKVIQNDNKPVYNIPGFFGIKIHRISVNGAILGTYSYTKELAGTKIELMKNNKSYKTTYSIEDTSLTTFFNFENVDTVGKYQIKVRLNDDFEIISSEFHLTEDDFKLYDSNFTSYLFKERPDLFNKGEYYFMGLCSPVYTLLFDFYENDFTSAVYPNPASNETSFRFQLTSVVKTEIDVLDIHFNNVSKILDSETTKPGNYVIQVNCSELDEGLYFIKIKIDSDESYTPFEIRRQ